MRYMAKSLFVFILLFSSKVFAQDVLIAFEETHFATRGINAPRASNIRLASSFVNETIIQPDEEFSFNQVVGPRTSRRGFRLAHVIQSGEITDGWGGGTCQTAGTLHSAIFKAGLEILESTQHSRMSQYLSAGFDTTVVYGYKDFRFRNSFHSPIKIKLYEVSRGQLRAEVWMMTSTERHSVSIEIVELVRRGFSVIHRENCSTLAPGQRDIVERGGPFLRIVRRRTVDGVLEEKTIRYNMAERIIDFCPRR